MSILNLKYEEEHIYNILLRGIQNNQREFSVPIKMNDTRLLFLVKSALSECNDLVNCDSCHINTVTNSYSKVLKLRPIFDDMEFPILLRQYNNQLDRICEEMSGYDVYNKVKNLYEYFLHNIRYDYVEAGTYGNRADNVISHVAYGALVEKCAVCEGIAYAFSAVLKRLGIESMVVSGTSNNSTSGAGPHAWNIVNINGELYHIDVTWGINSFEKMQEYTYDYFCLSDKEMEYDHKWSKSNYFPCNNLRYNYFRYNGLFIESLEELKNTIATQISNNEAVVFRLSDKVKLGMNPTRKIWNIISDVYKSYGCFYGSKTYTYDKNKKIFFMR